MLLVKNNVVDHINSAFNSQLRLLIHKKLIHRNSLHHPEEDTDPTNQ